ncbi:MAG TPA: 30S ribosomal protein S1 [Terriglobales bacterium]|jgi:small subunit ribosomal protein S1
MSDPNTPVPETANESTESFGELLSQYEKSHSAKGDDGRKQLEGTVVAITPDSVLLDIGYKSEGILSLTALQGESVKPGDKMLVSVKGRDAEGYYSLSRGRIQRPTDWASLERAFAEKATIVGTVTGAVKGGLSVDVGVRAFMPASRSGVRDAAELEKLVGQEIRCRIIKVDVQDEDVVVDRRVIAEEEALAGKQRRFSEIKEGDTVNGTVRSLTDYGAFVDIGGVDALLHVGDISWSRVNKPADVLSVGQEIEAKVLKISAEGDKKRISVGMKQLEANPWDSASQKYKVGERVRGAVTRVMDFGAFVELEPGIEGLIHVSEMSWARKIRAASDVVKPGETVDAVVLVVNSAERRISLGLKQTLGDPWADAAKKFAAGTVVEGPVTNITKFGAFVQVAEGVEGMIHISEMSAEKRLNHPQEMLKAGQVVKAQVLAVDDQKRQLRLSMKQLVPTGLDEYIAEHKIGDVVTGRLMEKTGTEARVELGEGVLANCRLGDGKPAKEESSAGVKADLSSLTSMLQARWKGGQSAASTESKEVRAGQVRSFRIKNLDAEAKKIEVELA